MASTSLRFRFKKSGIYIRGDGRKRRVADPILLSAFVTRNEGTQREAAYVSIDFLDRRARWKTEIIPSSMLTAPREFVERLASAGYVWPESGGLRSTIVGALSQLRPRQHIRAVDLPGWHGDVFVLPGEAYTPEGPNRSDYLIMDNVGVKLGLFRRGGRLSTWKKIAKICCHSSRGRCLMAAAFAAPNLRPLGIPSFGLNLSGQTSTGKTCLIALATSVPGLNSSEGPDTWDGSLPAYEQRALGNRDSIMPLDELGHVIGDPSEVARIVTFRVASNRPKAKARQYTIANNLVEGEFRVIAISTSEHPMWAHLKRDQRGHPGIRGEEVRMINLRANVSNRGDVFDGHKADWRIGKNVQQRARKIERLGKLTVQHQGRALRAYLTKRVADNRAEQKLRKYMDDYYSAAPRPKDYRWLRRIVQYFAILYASAALAIDYGILPWGKRATLADIRKCMNDAMEQLIDTFESSQNKGGDLRGDGGDLNEFKIRVENATFVERPRGTVSKAVARRVKQADGIIRRDKSGKRHRLLFSKTFKGWYPDASKRKRLTKSLRARRVFGHGRRRDTCTREIFLAELGRKVPCYALSRKRLRLQANRQLTVPVGGGPPAHGEPRRAAKAQN